MYRIEIQIVMNARSDPKATKVTNHLWDKIEERIIGAMEDQGVSYECSISVSRALPLMKEA